MAAVTPIHNDPPASPAGSVPSAPPAGSVPSALQKCIWCHKPGERLPVCGRCGLVNYCSKECQKSAWKIHKTVCNVLLSQEESSDRFTEHGLTPYHVLALEGRLEENSPLFESTYGATPQDCAQLVSVPGPDEPVCELLDAETGGIRPLTQTEFQRLTKATYTPFFYTSPKDFLELPSLARKDAVPLAPGDAIYAPTPEQVQAFKSSPPRLLLHQTKNMGLEVIAGEDIWPGQVIALFGGKFRRPSESDTYEASTRRSTTVNPVHYSGIGPFVNDGFPNCILSSIPQYRGIRNAPALIAITPILKGQAILYDYGPHHCVLGGLYGVSEESFVRAATFCASENFDNPRHDIDLRLKISLLRSSNLLIQLLLKKTLNIEKAKQAMFIFRGLPKDTHPLFIEKYPEIFRAVKKLLATNNAGLIDRVILLPQKITARSYVQILCLMAEKTLSTPEDLAPFEALGEAYDLLYLFLNGTLSGTMLGREEEAKARSAVLNTDQLQTLFGSLTSDLQKALLETVNRYYCFARENDLGEKMLAFRQLAESLRSLHEQKVTGHQTV